MQKLLGEEWKEREKKVIKGSDWRAVEAVGGAAPLKLQPPSGNHAAAHGFHTFRTPTHLCNKIVSLIIYINLEAGSLTNNSSIAKVVPIFKN